MKTLVVDDDETIRRFLENIIGSQGHEVTSCPDAETAWEAYQREAHPLVILDWKLPGMDGLELCRMIRQLPKGDRSMIVMISARNQTEDIKALLGAGADDFIAKPLDVERLKLIFRLAERQAKSLAERNERSVQLEIVEQIAKAVSSTLEPDELFQTILREIHQAIPCDRCVISRMENEPKGFLQWYYESDVEVGPLHVREDEQAEWFIREVYEPKRVKLIPDIQKESLLIFKHLREAGLRSLLIMPILQDDVSIAHIGLSSKNPDAFTSQHINLLTAISGHLGSAIRNATLFHMAEQRSSRLSTLQELNRQIAENLSLPEVMENITSAAVTLLRADFAQIFLVDEKSEKLNLIKWHGHIPAPPRHELPILSIESLGGTVTQKGDPIILPDVQKEAFWLEKLWARKHGIHSCIAHPLHHGGKIVGVINCLSREKAQFKEEDLDLLGALSSQAVVAIENARLFEESERRGDRLATLVEVAQRLTRGLDLADVMRTISENAAMLFEADTNIRLLEENELVLFAWTPDSLKVNQSTHIPVGESVVGRVAESGIPFSTSDVSTVKEIFPKHRENLITNNREAFMCIPLRLESRVVGTMTIYREKGHVFDEEAIRIATTLADQAAIAIENARLHEAERKSRKFLNSVLDTAAEAIITIGENGIVESFNRTAEKMFGYSEREVIGENIFLLMPDPYRENHDGYLKHFLTTGEKFVIGSTRKVSGKRRNGEIFPMELAVSEVRMDDQVKFTGIIRDITGRERNERALARLNRSLDEKNKDLETVFHVASHDLRSPLVNIQGYSKELSYLYESIRSALLTEEDIDALKRKIETFLDEDIPEALRYVAAGASKMDMLLSGLLRYSRLGHAALNIEPVDMNEMIENVSASLEYQIREAGAELKIEELPVCVSDAIQINLVFTNLLDNATKYLDPSRPGTIRVSGRIEDGQAIYCICDNGIGISKGYENKIFEIFHRLDNEAASGEGLGLTITHRILDRLNGKIWLESELGKGSDFYVALPAVDIEKVQEHPRELRASP